MRAIVQQTAQPGFCNTCAPEVGEAAIAAMAAICASTDCVPPTAAGNAALCLGHFAAEAAWRPALLQTGAIDALVGVARRGGRGRSGADGAAPAAARNAAITLAKAAAAPEVMERMRELRALEVFVANVRP